MKGHYVARRAGWDTHGLPVEVQVEKALGISGKKAIVEQVGIEEFTRLCRESVRQYVDDFVRLTDRIAYWLDMDEAYWTFQPSYVESVWWQLQQLFDRGLLYEDLKVVPYCPRCGTALSSHELGQPGVYTDEVDESAYVRLALSDDFSPPHPLARPTSPCGRQLPGRCCRMSASPSTPRSNTPPVDGVVIATALAESLRRRGRDGVRRCGFGSGGTALRAALR
jgi:hypothetical protein